LFSSGSYVLIITSRKDAGSYQVSPVYHANSMKFLCCNEAIKHLTPQEVWKNYRLACNFTHIVWSNKHWLYFLLGHCSTWSLHLNSLYYLPAEKGWGILHVSSENCRNYLWTVLLVWQGFDAKVSTSSCMYLNNAMKDISRSVFKKCR